VSPFTDCTERDVYEHASGQRYVVEVDGLPVYGQWLPPPDEPIEVNASKF
jgi:hypothetical protein